MTSFDVIIPIYRMDPGFLEECLASVRAQTHNNWQCWIIDGTPETWETYPDMRACAESYTQGDDRFHYLRQDDSLPGVSGARNHGVAHGEAPWIAFLDGDDWWFPECLEWVADALESPECHSDTVVVWTASDVVIELESAKTGEIYSSRRNASFFEEVDQVRQDAGHGYYFIMGHPPMTSQVVVQRDRFEIVQGFDLGLQMAEDTECWLRMLGSPREDPPLGSGGWGRFLQIPSVGGHHRLGRHQTIYGGQQTSASDDGDGSVNPDLAFDRFREQVFGIIGSRHPRPANQPEIDPKTQQPFSNDYWIWIRTSSAGMGRNRFLMGNLIPEEGELDDDRSVWV